MIKNKKDFKYYLESDEIARWGKKTSFLKKLKKGDLWKYMFILRKLEFSMNCKKGFFKQISSIFYRILLNHYQVKTGWTIPPNVCGPGLLVVHRGTVVISPKAKIGRNCRIHACVNIGDWNGGSPNIGNNVYIGPGAKIFGNINIADGVAIGANAVVNKSIFEESISVGGIPAKIISNKGNKYQK